VKSNSTDQKVGCFVSIPKCASKSVLVILGLGRNRDNDAEEPHENHVIYENHQRLCILQKKYKLDNKFVFCFVRNPYDRLVSWYEYHRSIAPYCAFTFKDWVANGCPTHWTVQNNTNWAEEGLSPLLQYNFIDPGPANYVGKIENFEADLRAIIAILNNYCRERGFDRRYHYRGLKINMSHRPASSKPYYDNNTALLVYRMFRKDFEEYGYREMIF